MCIADPCRWDVGHSRWATPYTAESQSPPARSLSHTGSEPHDPAVEPSPIFVHWGEHPVLDRKLCRNREWVNALLHPLWFFFLLPHKLTIIIRSSYHHWVWLPHEPCCSAAGWFSSSGCGDSAGTRSRVMRAAFVLGVGNFAAPEYWDIPAGTDTVLWCSELPR